MKTDVGAVEWAVELEMSNESAEPQKMLSGPLVTDRRGVASWSKKGLESSSRGRFDGLDMEGLGSFCLASPNNAS